MSALPLQTLGYLTRFLTSIMRQLLRVAFAAWFAVGARAIQGLPRLKNLTEEPGWLVAFCLGLFLYAHVVDHLRLTLEYVTDALQKGHVSETRLSDTVKKLSKKFKSITKPSKKKPSKKSKRRSARPGVPIP